MTGGALRGIRSGTLVASFCPPRADGPVTTAIAFDKTVVAGRGGLRVE
ncbi:hypothetical protein THTE_3989 [Thermogutta terrifontis]|uniref:Uncharacterized protein n=1 Tax=Thermogutta terrifontis TaxID=1331910 RepID=A0A286RKW0_9BACT|nr:hypothetical protein THTE_3989 [Thermogutta terrifontis]